MKIFSFTDTKNEQWDIEITVGTIKRVQKLRSINLADAIDIDDKGRPKADLLAKLASDPILLVDTIYAIVQPQAEQKNISSEAFADRIAGDVIETATDALMNGILEFLPPTKRLVLQKILTVASRNTERIREEAEKALNSPELDAEIDRVWNEQFTNMQESSE